MKRRKCKIIKNQKHVLIYIENKKVRWIHKSRGVNVHVALRDEVDADGMVPMWFSLAQDKIENEKTVR